ncbi:hypothetical protein EBN03_00770 [Nocardia stercoris]|uniref:Uncharacterized protein n=1 Tax=Nocardia stercoris TaxID=2483361 RepID=A0A3M2LDU4_9NOCA|nr:hypothetical protein EBN03_00770 [Nocardia stercoris]
MSPHGFSRLSLRAVALLSLSAAAAATAGAAGAVEFPQTPSMFYGGLCGGSIRTWADTDSPGRAVFNIQAAPITGVGPGTYSMAPLCEVWTNVDWHNTTTGAAGRYAVNVVSGIYGSIQYSEFQETGSGHVEVTVSTANPLSIPQHGAFDVP